MESDVGRAGGMLLALGCASGFGDGRDVAKGIPSSVLREARGVCFLFTYKAGFVGSFSGGTGVVVCRGADGRWGAPSSVGVVGGGLGLQIGATATESVLVLNTEAAVRSFAGTSQVRLGGDVTVAAGPVGRQAEGAVGVRHVVEASPGGDGRTSGADEQGERKKKSTKVGAAIWSYSLASGAFAGMAVTGVYVRARKDANADFYGPEYRAWGAKPADLVLGTPVGERLRDGAVGRSEALRVLYERLEKAEAVSIHKHSSTARMDARARALAAPTPSSAAAAENAAAVGAGGHGGQRGQGQGGRGGRGSGAAAGYFALASMPRPGTTGPAPQPAGGSSSSNRPGGVGATLKRGETTARGPATMRRYSDALGPPRSSSSAVPRWKEAYEASRRRRFRASAAGATEGADSPALKQAETPFDDDL